MGRRVGLLQDPSRVGFLQDLFRLGFESRGPHVGHLRLQQPCDQPSRVATMVPKVVGDAGAGERMDALIEEVDTEQPITGGIDHLEPLNVRSD